MNKEYEIKNCKRDWDKVGANKQHCGHLLLSCDNNICDNIYCMYNDNTIDGRQRLNEKKVGKINYEN